MDYPKYNDSAFEPHKITPQLAKVHALKNIDISLRRIADTLDIRKQYDEKLVECSKLVDENRRLSVDNDMWKDDIEKVRGQVAYLRQQFGAVGKIAAEALGHNEYADKELEKIVAVCTKEGSK